MKSKAENRSAKQEAEFIDVKFTSMGIDLIDNPLHKHRVSMTQMRVFALGNLDIYDVLLAIAKGLKEARRIRRN